MESICSSNKSSLDRRPACANFHSLYRVENPSIDCLFDIKIKKIKRGGYYFECVLWVVYSAFIFVVGFFFKVVVVVVCPVKLGDCSQGFYDAEFWVFWIVVVDFEDD